MNPNTLNLIIYIEQLAALVAKTVVDLKNVIAGSSTQTTDQILADADATYQQIIQNAQLPAPVPQPPTPGTSSTPSNP